MINLKIDPDHSILTNSVTVLLIILNSPRNNLYTTGESKLCNRVYRVVVQGQTMNFMSLGQVKDTLEDVPIKCLVEKSNLC